MIALYLYITGLLGEHCDFDEVSATNGGESSVSPFLEDRIDSEDFVYFSFHSHGHSDQADHECESLFSRFLRRSNRTDLPSFVSSSRNTSPTTFSTSSAPSGRCQLSLPFEKLLSSRWVSLPRYLRDDETRLRFLR